MSLNVVYDPGFCFIISLDSEHYSFENVKGISSSLHKTQSVYT